MKRIRHSKPHFWFEKSWWWASMSKERRLKNGHYHEKLWALGRGETPEEAFKELKECSFLLFTNPRYPV